MYSITKLGAGVVLLAGFVFAPAYSAMARDWGSHESRASHESHESHADRPHSDRAPSQNNFSPRSFQGGSPPSSHSMPPRDFRGAPPSFHGNTRNFERPDTRSFRRDFNGSQARDFKRDFRGGPPRDFGNRPTRDFQRPPRDGRGEQQQSQSAASHQFHGFHGHDVAHFTSQEREHWKRGNWHHGHHHGHNGWWFIVDDFWFFYDSPIYPYPGYVSYYYDDGYYGDQSDYYWYWCDDPQGYYPYVQECNGPWRPVPPTPDAYGPGAYDSGNYGSGDYGPDQYGPNDDGPYDNGPDQ
jgi:hypothetical protein